MLASVELVTDALERRLWPPGTLSPRLKTRPGIALQALSQLALREPTVGRWFWCPVMGLWG